MEQEKKFENYYIDIDYQGSLGSNGDIKKLIDDDALKQAFRFWLASSKGERLRSKTGGYVLPHLKKPINEERKRAIKRAILQGLRQDFTPYLEVIKIDVIPNYNKKQWTIEVVFYAPELKRAIRVSENLNTLG